MEPQITLVGNLTTDPARRLTAAGVPLTRLRVACSGRRMDKQTGEWVNTDPVYLSVTCWRQLADNTFQTLHKGDTVVVHGRLLMHEYVDGAGAKRQAYDVDAVTVSPDLGRYVAQLGRPTRELPAAAVPAQPGPADGEPVNPWSEPEVPDQVDPAVTETAA
jgi:single-strand DNA-binding protein